MFPNGGGQASRAPAGQLVIQISSPVVVTVHSNTVLTIGGSFLVWFGVWLFSGLPSSAPGTLGGPDLSIQVAFPCCNLGPCARGEIWIVTEIWALSPYDTSRQYTSVLPQP